MKIEFDLNELKKIRDKIIEDERDYSFTIHDYILFKFIVEGKGDNILPFFIEEDNKISQYWESLLYIKITEDDDNNIVNIEPRQKLTNLFPQSKGVEFDTFWNKWHEVTSKPKTDRTAAEKKWKRLTNKEKQKALDNIENYFESLNDKKYCKKARTYLEDKNFNDEFETTYQEDWTKEHK